MSLFPPEKLKSRLQKIEKELQQWLEPQPPSSVPFQVSTDFENDRFQIQTTDQEEFLILLFSRLSNYFEKGLLLEESSDLEGPHWNCSLHFAEGQLFVADPAIPIEFPIPSPGPHRVLRSTPHDWRLNQKESQNLIPTQSEWTALIYELKGGVRFLFFTRLAEPWLQLQTENAHKFIEQALSVQP